LVHYLSNVPRNLTAVNPRRPPATAKVSERGAEGRRGNEYRVNGKKRPKCSQQAATIIGLLALCDNDDRLSAAYENVGFWYLAGALMSSVGPKSPIRNREAQQ
jgi:hypothetical protein